MKYYLFFLLVAGFALSASAAPTIEGLFRHGNNADVTQHAVVLTMAVEELPTEVTKELSPPRFVKILFIKAGGRYDLTQIDYADKKFSDNSVVGVVQKNQLLTEVRREDISGKVFFYSLLGSLTFNDSTLMNAFMKGHVAGYKTNRELMNKDKVELLKKYKDYLIAVSEEGGSVKDAIKATKEGDAEERKKALDVISAGVYDKSDRVHLTKNENGFFWLVDLEKIKLQFTNEEHQFKNAVAEFSDEQKFEMEAGEFAKLNSVHDFPRTLSFKDASGNLYRMVFSGMTYINESSAEYQKLIKATAKSSNSTIKHNHQFLF